MRLPILFDVINKDEIAVLASAYADNLCFIAETSDRQQEMLDCTQKFTVWMGL